MDERLVQFDDKMKKSLDNLVEELATIRAGRANPHILDKIKVDYYGTPTALQQVANVNVPEPRMIQIQPWEPSLVKEIEKAILTSDLGLNPSNDGKIIRLVFPELTEERRAMIVRDRAELRGGFCRGCGYCMPCPAGIEINNCARMSLMLRRAPTAEWLTEEWQKKMHRIEKCLHCGRCVSKCPFGLNTPELLQANYKDYWEVLAASQVQK